MPTTDPNAGKKIISFKLTPGMLALITEDPWAATVNYLYDSCFEVAYEDGRKEKISLNSRKFAFFIKDIGFNDEKYRGKAKCVLSLGKNWYPDGFTYHYSEIKSFKRIRACRIDCKPQLKSMGLIAFKNTIWGASRNEHVYKRDRLFYSRRFKSWHLKEYAQNVAEHGDELFPENKLVFSHNLNFYIYPAKTKYVRFNGEFYDPDQILTHSDGTKFAKAVKKIYGYHHKPRQIPPQSAKWTIGFEVEKNEIQGKSREGSSLKSLSRVFHSWETDSSCGVEGITHIYDLIKDEKDFKRHCMESKDDLGEKADMRCGGHVTIALNRSGYEFSKDSVRNYLGLLYAIYRKRLNSQFCANNKHLSGWTESRRRSHYDCIRDRDRNIMEFRFPGRVRSAKQLAWRFGLFKRFIQSVEARHSWSKYIARMRFHLSKVYGKGKKLESLLGYADMFNRYLRLGEIPKSIEEYVPPYDHPSFKVRSKQRKDKLNNVVPKDVKVGPLPSEDEPLEEVRTSDPVTEVPSPSTTEELPLNESGPLPGAESLTMPSTSPHIARRAARARVEGLPPHALDTARAIAQEPITITASSTSTPLSSYRPTRREYPAPEQASNIDVGPTPPDDDIPVF